MIPPGNMASCEICTNLAFVADYLISYQVS